MKSEDTLKPVPIEGLPVFTRVVIRKKFWGGNQTVEGYIAEWLPSGRARIYVPGQTTGEHNLHIIPTFLPDGSRAGNSPWIIEEVLDNVLVEHINKLHDGILEVKNLWATEADSKYGWEALQDLVTEVRGWRSE